MEITDLITLCAGISLGAFLGILGNKITTQKENSNWNGHFIFMDFLGL